MLPSRLEIYGIILALVAVLGFGTYFYIGHLRHKITDLEQKNATLTSKVETLDKNQKATKKIVDNLAKIKERASGEKDVMQQAIAEPNPDNFVNFTRRYRVRPGDQPNPQNGKGTGYPKSKTGP